MGNKTEEQKREQATKEKVAVSRIFLSQKHFTMADFLELIEDYEYLSEDEKKQIMTAIDEEPSEDQRLWEIIFYYMGKCDQIDVPIRKKNKAIDKILKERNRAIRQLNIEIPEHMKFTLLVSVRIFLNSSMTPYETFLLSDGLSTY